MFRRELTLVVAVAVLLTVPMGMPAQDAKPSAKEQTAKLVAVLKSDAPAQQKAAACRQLAVVGTDDAVAVLAGLLGDAKLSHMARYAMEPIPASSVDDALRAAMGKLTGRLRIGVINSIGVRRDAKAVPALIGLLGDAEAGAAAAASLGKIGGDDAIEALAKARKTVKPAGRLAVIDAYLQAAEDLAAAGEKAKAAVIYKDLFAADEPLLVRRAALVGLADLGGHDGVSVVVAALRDKDPVLRATAINCTRTMKGRGVGQLLIGELPKADPNAQVLLIGVLADRGEAGAAEALGSVLDSPNAEVRAAATQALGKVGGASSVAILAKIASTAKTPEQKDAAMKGLLAVQGDGVCGALIKAMEDASPADRPALIELLMARNETGAAGAVLKQADGDDAGVRKAAFEALGRLAGEKHVPALTGLLVNLQGDSGRKEAERALLGALRKIADEARQADPAVRALGGAKTPAARSSLLRVLGGLGGAKSLATVQAATNDADETVKDAAVRALFDWPDAAAAPAVLDVLQTTKSPIYSVLALRSYVRLAGTEGVVPAEGVKMLAAALKHAKRPDEKKTVLSGLAKVAHPDALTMAVGLLGDNSVAAEAGLAAVQVASLISGSDRQAATAGLTKILAVTKNPELRKQATRALRQLNQYGDYIVAWQVAGPYVEKGGAALFNKGFTPEPDQPGKTTWSAMPVVGLTGSPYIIRLDAILGGHKRVAYVRTWVFSNKDQSGILEMGADDGLKAWVNGKAVHSNPTPGKCVPGEEKAKIALKRGWNEVLLKIVQDTGPWEFCARLRGTDGGAMRGVRVEATREPATGKLGAPAKSPAKPAGKGGKGGKKGPKKPPAGKKKPPAKYVPKGPVGAYVPSGDWTPVFNGKDLTGWTKVGDGIFKVEDGCLLGTQTDGKGGDLFTKSEWDNFELRVTYRVVWPANSGVWFRYGEKKGYQFDILKHPKPVGFSGTLYCPGKLFIFANLNESIENRDGWNEARIVARGDEITFWLNGKQTGTARDGTHTKGKIGIQVHGGDKFKGMKAIYKKIEIRKLVPASPKPTASATSSASAPRGSPRGVTFKMHRVGSYQSESCTVGDFNGDGKLDIIAGPYWYEAPTWKPHKIREMRGDVTKEGKGYRDDFMNAALDVDGDGRMDLVTCCWFAKQIDWYRNTGPGGGEWPMTVIEKDSNFECGDLWDIDGDGKAQEVLPATKHTCWYELGVGADGKRTMIRHDVDKAPGPFGSGVGDVNGDGRPDILRPHAWFEAPKDCRKGKWKKHPLALGHPEEGKALHTPQIHVYDINCDGLNDILTSAAHNYGIFWYQQVRSGGAISWKRHTIDKSWSQAHSLTLGDLDGDGDLDLVTGKRFFGHNGKDPGAHEPLCVYWYELKRGAKPTWTRHTITKGEKIGSALNVPVVDLDGDGDLDVIVTGKWGGPVYFENLRKSAKK